MEQAEYPPSPPRDPKGLSAADIREACVSSTTKSKYNSYLRGIRKWITQDLVKEESDTTRFFDESRNIDVEYFTPDYFERFLPRKRDSVKVVTLGGYRSTVKDLYRAKEIDPPAAYGGQLKAFFSGMKRLEANIDQSGGPRSSGKQPLPYSLYENLCESTLMHNDGGFAHLFLISQWNLMCRSVSVQMLNTRHFTASDDSIGCVFHKTKTNQEGNGPKDPRHIYANPLNPITCWILALAIYLACNPTQPPGPLFPGANQKTRFGKILGRLIGEMTTKTYGTHLIRKGVATFACSGSTGGPSIVSVSSLWLVSRRRPRSVLSVRIYWRSISGSCRCWFADQQC